MVHLARGCDHSGPRGPRLVPDLYHGGAEAQAALAQGRGHRLKHGGVPPHHHAVRAAKAAAAGLILVPVAGGNLRRRRGWEAR